MQKIKRRNLRQICKILLLNFHSFDSNYLALCSAFYDKRMRETLISLVHFFQVDALRLRLEEKESMLNKKSKQMQEMVEEKGTLAGEVHDIKDMMEVKERKVVVLQKKVSKQFKYLNCWKFEGIWVISKHYNQTNTLKSTLNMFLSVLKSCMIFFKPKLWCK